MSINKIPAEIWDDILELCHDADDWEVGRRLSQINKHFRETMLSTPLPWRRLRLTVPDLFDENEQKSFDEWAIELNRRSGNSMKHVALAADSVIGELKPGIEYSLRHFNGLDTFTLAIGSFGGCWGFPMECPEAKHVHAYSTDEYDSLRDWDQSHLIELGINDSVESVDLKDIFLRYRDSYSPKTDLSLKSASLDFAGSYEWSIQATDERQSSEQDSVSEYDDEDHIVFDRKQFEIIAASKQLESLNVAYTDTYIWELGGFKGLSLPSLKILSVKMSECNFLVDGDLPALESLSLSDCCNLRPEALSVFDNCMIKHLNLVDTVTPSFSFNQPCLVSLSLQASPSELKHIMDDVGFTNFTSLKALNLSFTRISLEDVFDIVKQLDLEQLVCDLPKTRKRDDCAVLESTIAEIVPHYWTTIRQYYKDISTNDDLEQYFLPHRRFK